MKFLTTTLTAFAIILSAQALAADKPATLVETPMLQSSVTSNELPPVHKRIPENPSVVQMDGKTKTLGRHGGNLRLLMGRAKDVRQLVVYGYSRLVAYNEKFEIVPDILEKLDVKEGRIFTLTLRKGHRWSDGKPFTAEDFRYWWEDMATNKDISKLGPPQVMLVDGEAPKFEVLNETTVRYSWSKPNPNLLPRLAGAAPLYIYRPAHFLKKFHAKYQDPGVLKELMEKSKRRTWVILHYRNDRQYRNDNPLLPSLQPWVQTTKPPAKRFIFKRNPYYYRIDSKGRQLPYLDQITMTVSSAKLIPAKAGSGDTDLQSRGLSLKNFPFLKQSEKRNKYSMRLWPTAKGSQMALFPNMSHADPVWRKLFRDVRFRRALSMAIDRKLISKLIYFQQAAPVGNTILKESPLFKEEYGKRWAQFDLKRANKLLDAVGLTKRDSYGIRQLPNGQPLEITVETAGEELEQTDILQLITDTWKKIGVKLFIKPSQREVLRNRIFAGQTQMAVWFGLENGIPSAESSPSALAPVSQQHLQWPKWGQYHETGGKAGKPVDMELPKKLMALNSRWAETTAITEKTKIWHEMLDIFTDQVYTIGIVSRVPQAVLVSARLRNVPKKAIYNWDPGAHFGIYRPDTFWFDGKR